MLATNLQVLPLANGEYRISFNTRSIDGLGELAEQELDVAIKKHRKRRSLSANAYLWVLCDKIAAKLRSTKEEVYLEAIRAVGLFDHVAIADEAVEAFLRRWNGQGLGYVAEVTEKAKNGGYKVLRVYSGSSTYDTAEMSRLIDYIVDEAKAQGIETLTPAELARMKLEG